MRLNPRMLGTDVPPIPEAKRWLRDIPADAARDVLDVSQAAPAAAPPEPLRKVIADAALTRPDAHLYGPVLGLPDLRRAVAAEWSTAYGGTIGAENVGITAGCNQAFTAVLAALAGSGDEVILPTPWYFNHKMWLDMTGVVTVPLPTGNSLIPSATAAEALITPRTRAIVLVTPNNPCGVEYPADTLAAFRDLARARDIALIVDETYRDFDARSGPPHTLFQDAHWDDTFIHLYSFSKAYRLTGHRVGAIIAAPSLLHEIEKFQDTAIICANQLGQIAALWGLENLADWKAGERDEILARRAAVEAGFQGLDGWSLLGIGAYFAFAAHPFDAPSDTVARRLVHDAQVLALPATMFAPESDPIRNRALRIAFANIDTDGIAELVRRLAAFRL